MKFENKNIIITGGSRGLGLALCEEFARQGANLLLIARDKEELLKAQSHLNEKFPERSFFILSCDLCSASSYKIIHQTALKVFPQVNLIVNNAGAIMVGPFTSMNEDDFRTQMEIHLFAPLKMIQLFLPDFIKQGSGQIVNICSMGGKVSVPNMLTYDASKFALAGLSQGLSAELKEKNIFVTTVYPALMMTGSPIQAVFKGQHGKSFDWFSCADYMPFVALPAEKAAKKIVNAAYHKKAELVIPWFAHLRVLGSAVFPNLMISTMRLINSFMPKEDSSIYKSGAEAQKEAHFFQKYFYEKAQKIQQRWNQSPKSIEKVKQTVTN